MTTILLFFGALWLLADVAMILGLCYCASLEVKEDEFPHEFPLARNGEDSRERLIEPLGTHNAGCPGVPRGYANASGTISRPGRRVPETGQELRTPDATHGRVRTL